MHPGVGNCPLQAPFPGTAARATPDGHDPTGHGLASHGLASHGQTSDFRSTRAGGTVQAPLDRTFPPPHPGASPPGTALPGSGRPGTVTLPLPAALRGAATARLAAHRLRAYPSAAALHALADALERALPPVVSRSALALALDVSPKTVTRWAAAQRVPLERPRPGTRLGVPTAFALAAVSETERLRHLPRPRRTRLAGNALRTLGNHEVR